MFCKNCGNRINAGEIACRNCGAKVESQNSEVSQVQSQVQVQENFSNQQTINNNLNSCQNGNNQNENNKIKKGSPIANIIVIILTLLMVILLGREIFSWFVPDDSESNPYSDIDFYSQDIEVGNYKVTVPSKLDGEELQGKLVLYDKKKTWTAVVEFHDMDYSKIVSNKDQFETMFAQKGYTINNGQEGKLKGTNYYSFETTANGITGILSLVEVNSELVAVVFTYNNNNNSNNSSDESILNKVIDTIKTVSKK